MTVTPPQSESPGAGRVHLARLRVYLQNAGWILVDDDDRSSMWRPPAGQDQDLRVVLPSREDVADYSDRVVEALRTISFAERRAPEDVLGDVEYGSSDTVAIRLTSDAPPGQASLAVVHSAVVALRNLVVGSAAALDVEALVLPSRRPLRAEAYADQTRLSTASGSFIINLSLPLYDDVVPGQENSGDGQEALLDVPSRSPYGRRVGLRMLAAAERATSLARQVGNGDLPIRSFGLAAPDAPNATELAALSMLGGPEQLRYRLRYTPSPVVAGAKSAVFSITPAEQRIIRDAADFLRTRQPRSGVTVMGLVVRLFRTSAFGSGEVVVQGVDDDFGTERRYRISLGEDHYNEAVRAHREGLQVIATGDLDIRGTRRSLMRLTSFAILPGLEED